MKPAENAGSIQIQSLAGSYRARFAAMACDCELLIMDGDRDLATRIARTAASEAWRIESKYSRYRDGNIVSRINSAGGTAIEVDSETADLIDYAQTCFQLSEGRFDLTSGVLRRLWKFDGTGRVPTGEAVRALLSLVGWDRVRWDRPVLQLKAGMEIDFGGIGKEYAVDRSVQALLAMTDTPCLVNYGGDLRTTAPRNDQQSWQVGINGYADVPTEAPVIELEHGAIATSGDGTRFLLDNGRRFGHLLDPRTGWPVEGAPRSVTVQAELCIEAGTLSSLAQLHGSAARQFLLDQNVRFWCD